jgi:UDP-N-acetylmuramate--alanine ligase
VRFDVEYHGQSLGQFEVRMPGAHNALNALATIAVADELRVDHDRVRSALQSFEGVQRRFSIVGEEAGVTVIDDYGHHPAEVEVTLEAAQRAYGARIVVAFQPHRYTRTRDLFDELTRAFNRADVLFLTEVYAAGEKPIEGADGRRLADAIRAHGHRDVTLVEDREDLAEAIGARAEPGDVVITLGAGDITRTGQELLEVLRR